MAGELTWGALLAKQTPLKILPFDVQLQGSIFTRYLDSWGGRSLLSNC